MKTITVEHLEEFDVLIYRAKILGLPMPFKHAALAINRHPDYPHTPLMVESVTLGPEFQELCKNRLPQYVCRYIRPIEHNQRVIMRRKVEKLIHKKYDWRNLFKAIVTLGRKQSFGSSKRLRCDELVVEIFKAAGIDLRLMELRPRGFLESLDFKVFKVSM